MVTIGENLNLPRYEVEAYQKEELLLKSRSHSSMKIALHEITTVEIIGVKNNSGYSGTMEWGMKNPTFILPTNFWFAILNWFKRQRDDLVYFKVTMKDNRQLVASSNKSTFKTIQTGLSRK